MMENIITKARLSPEQVEAIRILIRMNVKQADIASMFDCDPARITQIKYSKTLEKRLDAVAKLSLRVDDLQKELKTLSDALVDFVGMNIAKVAK